MSVPVVSRLSYYIYIHTLVLSRVTASRTRAWICEKNVKNNLYGKEKKLYFHATSVFAMSIISSTLLTEAKLLSLFPFLSPSGWFVQPG